MNIEEEIFAKTNKLISKATFEWKHLACYWLRGLTPNRGKRNNEIEIHEAITWSTPRFDEVLQASKLSYTDGTSGVGEVPIYIRPSAFGAVTFKYRTIDDGKPEIYDIQVLGGQVPGEQTVPRAETWAANVLLTRVNSNAVARVGIDAAYVVNGVENRHKLVKGRNGDLWGLFLQASTSELLRAALQK